MGADHCLTPGLVLESAESVERFYHPGKKTKLEPSDLIIERVENAGQEGNFAANVKRTHRQLATYGVNVCCHVEHRR